MKAYKARIQHTCGYPEPQLKESHILTQEQVYSGGEFHNFTCTPFQDCNGIGHTFECERNLTRYRVIMSSQGVLTLGIAKRNERGFTTVQACLSGHTRLLQGVQVTGN